jgi:small-conductance mechanosensitive channel
MAPAKTAVDWIGDALNTGIAGTQFTPLKLVIVMLMFGVLVWATGRSTRWLVRRVLTGRGLDLGLSEMLGALVRYLVIGVGMVVILQSAGIDLTALNVLLGALGVGLGFGLQNVASNFVSGIIMLLERPVTVGDRIEIGGVTGEVRVIGARATTLVTDQNVAVVVPNSQFVTERVTNWSRPAPLTAYSVAFHVTHGADVDAVTQALLAAAGKSPAVLREPAPSVELADAGLSGLRFVLQVWSARHLRAEGALRSELNRAVSREFAARGVPWARRTDQQLAPIS